MMDKIFKFKQETDVKKYYEKIGLKFNPFPLGGEPSKDQPYIIISEEVTSEITEFIDSVTASKKWQGLSLIGNNGRSERYISVLSSIFSYLVSFSLVLFLYFETGATTSEFLSNVSRNLSKSCLYSLYCCTHHHPFLSRI